MDQLEDVMLSEIRQIREDEHEHWFSLEMQGSNP